jgi:hypothetical protein
MSSLRWIGVAAVLLAAMLGQASADQSSSTPVPAYWVSYAQLASNQLLAWLDDGSDPATSKLHRYLEHGTADSGAATSPAASDVVRIWIAPDGHITEVSFNSLGDQQADAELRQILTQRPIGEPPPADMPQPLVLRLRLKRRS